MNDIYTNLGKDVFNDIEMFEPYTKETECNTVIKQFECFMPNESCKSNIEEHLRKSIHNINILQYFDTKTLV